MNSKCEAYYEQFCDTVEQNVRIKTVVGFDAASFTGNQCIGCTSESQVSSLYQRLYTYMYIMIYILFGAMQAKVFWLIILLLPLQDISYELMWTNTKCDHDHSNDVLLQGATFCTNPDYCMKKNAFSWLLFKL